ncbi:conserved hypothetical protein [Methanocella paludicola SANAE]|uniref:Peptidase S24/S26A/S26B/S26C domain-containing protein n=1 Tax=Methanocella paludicola (strain DSM 17711 / JCM 13418 / NBRC 101707 / SANAE) TaxID=304371 RepID=D1YWY2_METPS|nr:signal peptidase I [Methanocella paludicola]BAI60954.1 conserved hypothetical protein [Methanocella paludicola SANAE]
MNASVKSLDDFKQIVYTGNSMYPLFRDLDVLYIAPCNNIQSGDVIVFKWKDEYDSQIIAHRVISIHQNGVTTKGDNNILPDRGFRTPEYIMGMVYYVKHGKRISRVYNGGCGIIFSKIYGYILSVNALLLKVLNWPYRILSRFGICRAILPRFIKYRVITIKRPDGDELLLVVGQHMLGKYVPATGKWNIRPPFRLFIDDKSLPKPSEKIV